MNKPSLVCKKVTFYSPGDEEAFFNWLSSIKGVKRYEYGEDGLRLYTSRVTNSDLWELIGLFYRYNVDMKQLRQFITGRNERHFRVAGAFWYTKIFK